MPLPLNAGSDLQNEGWVFSFVTLLPRRCLERDGREFVNSLRYSTGTIGRSGRAAGEGIDMTRDFADTGGREVRGCWTHSVIIVTVGGIGMGGDAFIYIISPRVNLEGYTN